MRASQRPLANTRLHSTTSVTINISRKIFKRNDKILKTESVKAKIDMELFLIGKIDMSFKNCQHLSVCYSYYRKLENERQLP